MLADGTIDAFRLHEKWAIELGSPLYAELLARAVADLERGGALAALLDGWQGRPLADALPLRLLGGVHHLVLDGAAPELARFYPSVGGVPHWPECWEAFCALVAARAGDLRAALQRQVQTNEVRRSGTLLGGFLTVARATGLPLHVLEIGCSAGLNLLWDRYRYEQIFSPPETPPTADDSADHRWGDPRAAVVIRTGWHGDSAVLDQTAVVTSRAGCDLAPVDVRDPAQVRTLESFVWPDQLHRLAMLRAAVAAAHSDPPPIDHLPADQWLAVRLPARPNRAATVVFHSIMWNYLSHAEHQRIRTFFEEIGARAHAGQPLAWLRSEFFTNTAAELRLTLWPGGHEHTLAVADPHGRWVRWLEPAVA